MDAAARVEPNLVPLPKRIEKTNFQNILSPEITDLGQVRTENEFWAENMEQHPRGGGRISGSKQVDQSCRGWKFFLRRTAVARVMS